MYTVVEVEYHFLLKCSIYQSCTDSFLESLKSFLVFDFKNLNILFVELMGTLDGDYEISLLMCDQAILFQSARV